MPRLNDCSTPDDVAGLHHKLVQFDCQIQDQYDEEFFISFLPKKFVVEQKEEGEQTSPGKSAPDSALESSDDKKSHDGLITKYFSELTDEQVRNYGTDVNGNFGETNMHGGLVPHVDASAFMQERGNSLAVSITNVNTWVQDITNRR